MLLLTNPATKAPDTAVKKTRALTPIVMPRILFTAGRSLPTSIFFAGSKMSSELQKRTEYKTMAVDKWAASRYCDTRGTSDGPSKFFGSNPLLTMYHPEMFTLISNNVTSCLDYFHNIWLGTTIIISTIKTFSKFQILPLCMKFCESTSPDLKWQTFRFCCWTYTVDTKKGFFHVASKNSFVKAANEYCN